MSKKTKSLFNNSGIALLVCLGLLFTFSYVGCGSDDEGDPQVEASDATTVKLTNGTGAQATYYITLGATPGCVQDVADLSFSEGVSITKITDLQGSFSLTDKQTVTLVIPQGKGINGTYTLGGPPLNCPGDGASPGNTQAEFILNNSSQGVGAQETIDITLVPGVSALVSYTMSGGGNWNNGAGDNNVTSFSNGAKGTNADQSGVFPVGCDDCNSSAAPPACVTAGGCATAAHCNVQRDATTAGGTVSIEFKNLT